MLAAGEDPRLVTALRAGEEGHVAHHAEHGDVHALEHAEAADGVAQGDVLRRGHDDGAVEDDLLADGELDVAGARGQVEEEHVQGTPGHGVEELVHGLGDHEPAPGDRGGVHEGGGVGVVGGGVGRLREEVAH